MRLGQHLRFGLPLMVATSLSIHVIALAIWLIYDMQKSGAGAGTEAEPPGPTVILSKEIAPEESSKPRPPPTAPPPPLPSSVAAVPSHQQPPPTKTQDQPAAALTPLAANGGSHSDGGVVFLLDISGSMYEAYAGATRLALARKLIFKQINALPEGTPFAIALYGETTKRSGPLMPANHATKEAAEQYLAVDYDCGGGTNLPAGFTTAQIDHPASIILVTDGDLNIVTDLLLKESRRILGKPGPQLAIFAIAPRSNTGDAEQLQDLAHSRGASYQEMDVPHAKQTAAPNPANNNH